MQNNYKDLNNLSDKELSSLIFDITKVLGADPKRAANLAGDPAKVKKMLSSMSNQEIEALINRAGKEKSQQIYETLERRKNHG